MPLHESVPPKRIIPRLDVLKRLVPRRSGFPAVPQAVRSNIIPLLQHLLYLFIQIRIRGPHVRELRVAAVAGGWEFVRAQEGEAATARVEAAVGVEETVSAAEPVAVRAELRDGAVVVEVADVEELVVREA